LDKLGADLKIFLVETNGLPNLSDGDTPDIKSLDYGWWANELFEKLNVERAFVAGASFGGLICMKLAIVKPERIKAAFLLNPGCLQPFSLTFANLFYNLLPIFITNEKNVRKFLEKAVFAKPNHQLSPQSEQMLVDYEVFAISRYKDKTQKPYYMDKELADVKADTFLLVGDKDLLFPFQNSIDNARRNLSTLKDTKVFNDVGHGIETYEQALKYIGERIKDFKR
jgi:pimeloyl-ACP methyl ester carboxylesterase